MKAARYYGPGDIRIEDIPEPQAKPGQIKIKFHRNGICGTDLHAYLQPLSTAPTFTKPDYLSGETLPVTLGHELSGAIVDIGEGVDSKFAIGQNVCVEPIMSCMSQENCRACRNGSRNICPHLSFIGISGFGGGLAEYICADALVVHILPDGIPLEIGATIEPLAVAYHAVKRSGYKKGDTALISGAGPIGLFLLKVLRSIDTTSTIIVSEPAAIRRQFALKHGATIAHNPLEKDIVSVVLEATGGDGVEKAFDAAGIQPSIDACLGSVRSRGTIVLVALWEHPAKIDPMIILLKELFLTGIICYDGEHPELLKEVAAGKFPNIEDLITRKIALKDLVEQGMEALADDLIPSEDFGPSLSYLGSYTMKAARYYGPGDIRIEDIPVPPLKDGQVKIKIACDIHAYLAGLPKFPTLTTPGPLSGETLPVTLGHEFSGTIVELGTSTDDRFAVGQNVCIEPVMSCRREDSCWPCLEGFHNLCPLVNSIGIGGWGGGLSEFVCVDQNTVHILPEGISLEVGACLEPLAVAWHAVKRSGYKMGDTALILGAGPIGLFLLKALRAIDPNSIIVVSEPAALRLEVASQHGATITSNPLDSDIPAIIAKATNGKGIDHAFDAAGVQSGIDLSLKCVRPRGSVMLVALWEVSPKIDLNLVLRREITVTGSICYDRVHGEVLEALKDGRISDIDSLITSRIALEKVVEQGIKALIQDKDKQVKILVHP
ncbi:hypothetical protein EYR36_004226 [Pleurotus pulmonarius]|nr:hypothetical protein EYR36_004226 [Pleurotus pulmonarius]